MTKIPMLPMPPTFMPDGLCRLTNNVPTLQFFKTTPEAVIPKLATAGSACFDLCACLEPTTMITAYNMGGTKKSFTVGPDRKILIGPAERFLVPTGLIMDIPQDFSVRLHPRSGLALKKGISLSNCEGVIDSDYVEPVFVILCNFGSSPVWIEHGDRICQGEIIQNQELIIQEIKDRPQQKTSRSGGFGSTG